MKQCRKRQKSSAISVGVVAFSLVGVTVGISSGSPMAGVIVGFITGLGVWAVLSGKVSFAIT